MDPALDAHSNLHLTFATWVAALHALGVRPADDAIAGHCDRLAAEDAAAAALVAEIRRRLPDVGAVTAVRGAAEALFGPRTNGWLGEGDRAERLARIRKYQFGRQLPWLARIWERQPDGVVAPTWLLVEQVTDRVRAMDPNPWNDVDEARTLPVEDFQVLWELDGCTAIAVQ